MPKLIRISGNDLLKTLYVKGFIFVRQKGSHVRIVMKEKGINHYVTIPLHDELDRGTLKSILRSLQKCFSEELIQEIFYTE